MHKITLYGSAQQFECDADRVLLAGMAVLGRKGIPIGCRGGGCGVCKIKVLSGNYECKVMSRAHVSEAEQAAGIGLACRIYPRSNLSISVLGKMKKAL